MSLRTNERLKNKGNKASQRILCLWLPNWPIQRLVVALPELRKQRVVLFSQDARRKQMVVAASPLAQLEGVQVDTPLTEAKAILSRAAYRSRHPSNARLKNQAPERPGVEPLKNVKSGKFERGKKTEASFFRIFQHVPQDDHEALQALAAELDSYSPIVGLQTGVEQPDCIFLDITGLAPLFGGEAKLADAICSFCHSYGYLARIGIAHTLGLAQGMAQHITNQQSSIFIVSEPQCEAVLLAGEQTHHLAQAPGCFRELPIESLRLIPEMTRTLAQLGIFRVEQLLQVPRQELFSRFGNEIYTRLDQFTGRVDEPIEACPRPREFYAEQLLEQPTNHKETIEVIMERLIQKICQKLKGSQQGALQWTIRLYGQQKLPVKLHVRLFAPTAQADQVVQLARMQLEQVLQPELVRRKKKKLTASNENVDFGTHPRAKNSKEKSKDQWIQLDGQSIDVNEINVTVTSSVLLENRQRELFDENPRADKQALAHLINRLSGRLGHRHVLVPSLVSGNQPENAYQLKPLVHSSGRQSKTTVAPILDSKVLSRPFRMIYPACPIEVVALAPKKEPDTSNQSMPLGVRRSPAPVMIVLDNRRFKVTQHWGPERIETGWWKGTLVRRDYWKIETNTSQQFWVYYDLRQQRWFLQGEF